MTQAIVLPRTDMRPPKVTVLCMTYNHRPYIEDALRGFMMQRTDYPVEFLIHDDASDDGTAEIVREWHERHPDRITAVLERVNQRTLRDRDQATDWSGLMRGTYLALCEGDDCWTDPRKLQRQTDALDAHPAASLCVHAVEVVSADGTPTGRTFPGASSPVRPGIWHRDDLLPILLGDDSYPFHTSSYVLRSRILREAAHTPAERQLTAMGMDYVTLLLASLHGDVIHLDGRPMSRYRELTAGSYSDGIRRGWIEGDPSEYVRVLEQHIRVGRLVDEATGGGYHALLQRQWERNEILRLMALGRFRGIRERYAGHDAYDTLPRRVRLMIGICRRWPFLYRWYKRMQMMAR